MTKKTRSSHCWQRRSSIIVIDPDGWDRNNLEASWCEPISLQEYDSRVAKSTAFHWADQRAKKALRDGTRPVLPICPDDAQCFSDEVSS